ncbi:FtsK/SpoIIIE domain-containing protein [Streptomyces sp. NPDC002130]|uniref:FtsK/SpoIIIE domain-containing protein n=1 Tax=Streptomyces sp. NPDC002130 TaxID=3155568 RepID=UPI003327299F
MEWIFTLVTPDGAERDVVLEAHELAHLGHAADEIAAYCGLPHTPQLFGRGGRLPYGLRLAEAPLYDGESLWLDHAPPGEEARERHYSRLPENLVTEGPGGTLLYARPSRQKSSMSPEDVNSLHHEQETVAWVFEGGKRRWALLRLLARMWGSRKALAELMLAYGLIECPGPDVVRQVAYGTHPMLGSAQLWRRHQDAENFLRLRAAAAPQPNGRPLMVSLPGEAPVLGIAGPGSLPRETAAWLVAQAALLHGPADVGFRVLTDPAGEDAWAFMRWLPAARAYGSADPRPRVDATVEGVERQIREVLDTIWQRQSRREVLLGAGRPVTVLILDGARRLRSLRGVPQILDEGPGAGVYTICLESEARYLPSECRAVIEAEPSHVRYRPPASDAPPGEASQASPGGSASARGARPESAKSWVPDRVTREWLEETARGLAPLRDAAAQGQENLRYHRLFDLLGQDGPDSRRTVAHWRAFPRSTRAVVGAGTDGPEALDLRAHGPHALITGATGSGKTELLRTWLASLAAVNRPDEMNFLLIDYKGTLGLGDLGQLPHTVALTSDLDGAFGRRVLAALGAELRRRMKQLGEAHARDFQEYAELRDRSPGMAPMPRLVVVVEEFSPLAHELPEVLQGLIDTARRSRSLGVHLILTTQSVGGQFATAVRSLTNIHIALRTFSAADSIAAIGVPDAAFISGSSPGRAYVRLGARPLFAMQTALVAHGIRGRGSGPDVRVRDAFGPVRARRGTVAPHDDAGQATDVDLLARALRDAAEALQVPAPVSPLPPPLSDVVRLTDIEPQTVGRDLPPLAFALADVPEEQAHLPALLDLAGDRNLRIVGKPGSGRSQVLRTLAAAVARQHSAADVHVYGIDCGDGALQALTELPHCGAVVTAGRPDLVMRLLGRLTATVRRRHELLHQGGFEDVAAQRQAVASQRRMPYLLVLVDSWEAFVSCMEATEQTQAVDDMQALLRDGPRAGVCTVLAGAPRPLGHRKLGSYAERVLVLPLRNREDYEYLGIERYGPIDQVPGRALDTSTGRFVQIAVLPGPLTRKGQTDGLAAWAAGAEARGAHVPPSRRPFRVEDFPLVADQFHVGDARGRPIGREEELTWLRDRFAAGTSVALLGQRRAGKSWVLEELSRRLRDDDGARAVRRIVLPPGGGVDSPDALAELLDDGVRGGAGAARRLIDRVGDRSGRDRPAFLLDEIGRLVAYDPVVVSWLRDLGQAGAWLVYTGTEKDWNQVVRWALTAPGSSFGNDVNARVLGPLGRRDALTFLTGTAANLGVDLAPERTGTAVVGLVGTWPFYLQVAGDAVVRAVQANSLRPLTDTQALKELVDERLIGDWNHHFLARWAEIGEAGRAALLAEPGCVPADAARAQRQDLREVGLLRHADEWLSDRPFFDWIARNASPLRDGEPHR